jgi:alpha-mannosidase
MSIKFGAYRSSQFHSGAYLFRPESNDHSAEKDVLESFREKAILIVSGTLTSDVSVIYGQLLAHTVRIFNTKTFIDNNFFIENDIDFEMPPKNRETEMYMRFTTDIENGELPEFYSDLNGFQWIPRVKVNKIGIEGNYFPITTGAFIQDEKHRLTLITNHAQGAAALELGQLEVMLDRRTLYDDYRGMGEGVVDSRLTRHQFWVSIEQFDSNLKVNEKPYQLPSLETNHLINILNYPINIYFVEKYDETTVLNLNKYVQLLNYNLPCDLHLFNLRTLTDPKLPLFPTESALFIVHRQGYDCRITNSVDIPSDEESLIGKCSKLNARFDSAKLFKDLRIAEIYSTSLTGLHVHKKIKSFASEIVEPMELKTFNLTFF